MATVVDLEKAARVLEPEQRVVIRDVDWDGYETLLRIVGDGHVRLAYDGSDVELMSSSFPHERFKVLISSLIHTLTLELNVPCNGLGSTTWRKLSAGKGLEADACFYLANCQRIVGKREIDLTIDPPPDLAIDVEISPASLDRMSIYAALGVPEVWRFDGERLTIEQLRADGTYAAVPVSPGLPMLPAAVVVRWIRLEETMSSDTEWARRFRDWVRAELLPGREGR